jgi:hypothetical protein
VQFEIPYSVGAAIQISGRAANVNNQEGSPDLCPLTRWTLGGAQPDAGIAPAPEFFIAVPGGGNVTLYQVGFDDLTNTSSVTSGTLQLFYWNELQTPSTYTLAAAVDAQSTTVQLVAAGTPYTGQLIQVGSELMTVLSNKPSSNTYSVIRGALGSPAAAHNPGDAVLHLQSSAVIAPFAAGFFGNRASMNYLHTVNVPDIRICAAEFFVTNSFGNSQASQRCYTTGPDGGLRSLSGGQFSLQASGYLATQTNAAPPLIIEASHAVRDIRATVSQAPMGYNVVLNLLQNGTEYCSLTIASGNTTSGSPPLDGVNLPPLQEGANLTMNLTLQPVQGFSGSMSPGRDLTVTIRL